MTDFTNIFRQQPIAPPPMNAQQLVLLGLQHMGAGRMSEAEACFRRVQQLDPNPTTTFLLAMMLPPIYQSNDDIVFWRQRMTRELEKIRDSGLRLYLDKHLAVPTFPTAYQGQNDRALHQLVTGLYEPPSGVPAPQARAIGQGEKIRVGFISTYFREHTIGRLNMGMVAA